MESNNPYQTPEAEVTASDNSAKEQTPKFFATRGRIGRMRYWCYTMSIYLLSFVVAIIASAVGTGMGMSESDLEPVATIAMVIVMLPFSIIFSMRRGHDLGMKSAYVGLMFVPLVNLFYGLYLTFAAGTEQQNEYGLPPSPNSTGLKVGFGLAILGFIGLIALIFMVS